MVKPGRKMSLDDYFDFFESRNSTPLSVYNLNQILAVHGFKQVHNVHKQLLVDAVNTIELIDPRRSTLSQNIESLAVMTLKQLISDLRDLNWLECYVTSLQTISSSSGNNLDQEVGILDVELSKSKSRKKGSKSKVVDATTVNKNASYGDSLSNSTVISEFPGKLGAKRKRKMKEASDGDPTACSHGSC